MSLASCPDVYTRCPELPEVRTHFRGLIDRFVAGLPRERPVSGTGRGIVTCGGGYKHFPSLMVQLHVLRNVHRCTMPIEVWHLGPQEIDPTMRRLLTPFNVSLIDAELVRERHPVRILHGWELKPYAITHSRFREVLFLDADSAPTRDPSELFGWPQYQRFGAVFWPDLPAAAAASRFLTAEVYDAFGVPPPARMEPPPIAVRSSLEGRLIDQAAGWDVPFESGQILVDKQRCWRELALATWICCQWSDYFFRLVYGDKEAFHLAWRRLGTPYAMPQFWPVWDDASMPGEQGGTLLQHDFSQQVLFEHRTQNKWNTIGNGYGCRTKLAPHGVTVCAVLGRCWRRTWQNDFPTTSERKLAADLAGTYCYRRIEYDERRLELKVGGAISCGAAANELRWDVWDAPGGAILSLRGNERVTCALRQGVDGVWRGSWLSNEKMPVEMYRLKRMAP